MVPFPSSGELFADTSVAAIGMTLCELATANHSPPLECVSLTVEAERSGDGSRPPLNSCVECVDKFQAAYMRLVGPDKVSGFPGLYHGVHSTGRAILGTFEKSVSITMVLPDFYGSIHNHSATLLRVSTLA